MSKNIKPCPFCGSENISLSQGTNYKWMRMECDDCGASCGEIRKIDQITLDNPKNLERSLSEWNKRYE